MPDWSDGYQVLRCAYLCSIDHVSYLGVVLVNIIAVCLQNYWAEFESARLSWVLFLANRLTGLTSSKVKFILPWRSSLSWSWSVDTAKLGFIECRQLWLHLCCFVESNWSISAKEPVLHCEIGLQRVVKLDHAGLVQSQVHMAGCRREHRIWLLEGPSEQQSIELWPIAWHCLVSSSADHLWVHYWHRAGFHHWLFVTVQGLFQ